MTRIKEFFNITETYKFEWNDLRAGITILNVVLIMIFGLSISWFGLAVAVFGLVKDFTGDKRISGILMYLSSVALNSYFLILLYRG
ncbi:MAG: hypothetical protein IKI31_01670 [Treponema sp.]|nr:hypothetical protein [Treponema sp.]